MEFQSLPFFVSNLPAQIRHNLPWQAVAPSAPTMAEAIAMITFKITSHILFFSFSFVIA